MLLMIGDDWAEDHHDIEIQDDTGRRLSKARLPEGLEGIARLHALIAQHAPADWAELSTEHAADLVFVGTETDRGPWVVALRAAGRPIPGDDYAIHTAATAAGIGHVHAHQLRHTLATQARNRGMSLEAISALLGHKTMTMTLVYARIADKTVADQYFSVTEKVQALYQQQKPAVLPAADEPAQMRKLRAEHQRRMLGNAFCARPVELDCHYETICESCTHFATTEEHRTTLTRQLNNATKRPEPHRQKVYLTLLNKLDDARP
ncbi:tyrosine-type recombinase/integrase [Nakamurella sp. PAMC28650]|uniref:tyrosine-type recombinase/integrase n=1 Tax=Nakamurella sp. PAMC28650 TaxID=2762325 RepID=UPI00164DC1EA|nr:tyrosine-type recombinase/integrase [Nakamurella sp. PAMC28650]QNK82882.1 tyrosine-type recombinase/integrase [Nakamurella sp. PAMC28650]